MPSKLQKEMPCCPENADNCPLQSILARARLASEAWIPKGWEEFDLMDCGGGMKLERWGQWLLARPDPQVLWPVRQAWKGWHAWYHRSSEGGGEWEQTTKLPAQWQIR